MSDILFPALAVACLVILCCFVILFLIRKQRFTREEETRRLVVLQEKIAAALADEGFETDKESFKTSLKIASLTTGLQRPRLENLAKLDKQPPEKYRILSKLALQGLGAEEIAAILDISTVEAVQLLSLSQVAKINH
ncbi:nucleoside transporter family protein [Desulfobulbus oligotrophicus]|jgi:DNA-directed RNA polymerase specialized sigma24 family protein|uniref:Uncharacterized protein n=1 Tax=Desulfobulbus oligotrophicus TaxID=1909699 RepID=A0A7T5VDR5_9BACT|nr:hypothetical protein [Desulfobulbus oligotrophicus]MDY0389338.1 hypothetical protein [Desulfobulbus oligotrophicus]QQG66013.1 hypothetical protein HP555_09105 [Desulfobulbus oligotrophicus]